MRMLFLSFISLLLLKMAVAFCSNKSALMLTKMSLLSRTCILNNAKIHFQDKNKISKPILLSV